MIESEGPVPDLFFHLLDSEGNRVPKRLVTPGSEKSPDRCFLEKRRGANPSGPISWSKSYSACDGKSSNEVWSSESRGAE